jgi:hypothetical protein
MNSSIISIPVFLSLLTFIPIVLGFVSIIVLEKFIKIKPKYLLTFLFILEILALFKFFFSLCEQCDLGSSPMGYYWFYQFFVLPLIFFVNYVVFNSSNDKLKYFLIIHFLFHFLTPYFVPSFSQRFTTIQSFGLISLVLLPQVLIVIKSKIALIKTFSKKE